MRKAKRGDLAVQGTEVHYELSGNPEGPLVTLSHALGANFLMWEPQLAVLRERYRVLRYDTRGHGESGVPEPPYTLEEMADDVAGLLDALGLRETSFVGLSMGGMVAQTFALRHPDRLRALALCDTTSEIPDQAQPMWDDRIQKARDQGMAPHVEPTVERWLTAPTREAQPEKAQAIRAWVRATDPKGYIGCCEAIRKLSLTDRLSEIKTPTLVLVGAEDAGTSPDVARRIHEHLPTSELVVLERAAHLTNFERPEAFNEALTDFLGRHAGHVPLK